jgi:hypothetical protein
VSVRSRSAGDLGGRSVETFIAEALDEIARKNDGSKEQDPSYAASTTTQGGS